MAMFSYRNEKKTESSDSSDDEDAVLAKVIPVKKEAEDEVTGGNQSMEVSNARATTSMAFNCVAPKRKANHVWTAVMSENLLSEDLGQFELQMKHFKSDRSVEAYDYTIKNKFSVGKPELLKIFTGGQNQVSVKKEFSDKSNDQSDSATRGELKNKVTFSVGKHEAYKVSKTIAKKLNEPNQEILCRTVRVLGSKKALQTLHMVQEIENNGGMKVLDGSRRRTPGGVYLYLLKTNPLIERHFKNYIFEDSYANNRNPQRKSQKKMRKKNQSKKKSFQKNPMESDHLDDTLKPLPTHLQPVISPETSVDSFSPTELGGVETSSSSNSNSSHSPAESELVKTVPETITQLPRDEMSMEEIEDGEIVD